MAPSAERVGTYRHSSRRRVEIPAVCPSHRSHLYSPNIWGVKTYFIAKKVQQRGWATT